MQMGVNDAFASVEDWARRPNSGVVGLAETHIVYDGQNGRQGRTRPREISCHDTRVASTVSRPAAVLVCSFVVANLSLQHYGT